MKAKKAPRGLFPITQGRWTETRRRFTCRRPCSRALDTITREMFSTVASSELEPSLKKSSAIFAHGLMHGGCWSSRLSSPVPTVLAAAQTIAGRSSTLSSSAAKLSALGAQKTEKCSCVSLKRWRKTDAGDSFVCPVHICRGSCGSVSQLENVSASRRRFAVC